MKNYNFSLIFIFLLSISHNVSAQKNVASLVERALEEAERKQNLNGKFLIADLSGLPKRKVVSPDIVKSVVADRYKIRNMTTIKRTVFGKIHKHVTRFEFRDLELVRQDEIEEKEARIAAIERRKAEYIANVRYRDSMKQVQADLLVKMNEDREKYLPGMWLSSADEIIQIHENGVIEIVQLKGEQLSIRVYWKYDSDDSRLLISSDRQEFYNLGRMYFSDPNTVTFYRFDGKEFTMSHTSKAAIKRKLRNEALAQMFLGSIRGTMTRDDEYDEYLDYLRWREKEFYKK